MQYVRLLVVANDNRKKYLDYLLLADESKKVVNSYIHKGELYTINLDNQEIGVALFIFLDNKIIELKNIAIAQKYRNCGYGKCILQQAFNIFKEKGFEKMIVGTANSSIANLAFYQKAGFRMSAIKKDFFLTYPEPIIEDGIRAFDMVLFEKEL